MRNKICRIKTNNSENSTGAQPFLALQRKPDVYHDPEEIIWKHVVLNSYNNIASKLNDTGVLSDPKMAKLKTDFINLFNSNHSLKVFSERTTALLKPINARLNELGKEHVFASVINEVSSARDGVNDVLKIFKFRSPSYPHSGQSHILDGRITIAGMSLKRFSSQNNYFSATLKLFLEKDERFKSDAEVSFQRGAILEERERELISRAKQENWEIVDLITQQLLNRQILNKYESLSKYEYNTNAIAGENLLSRRKVIMDAYYFTGFIISTVAYFNNPSKLVNLNETIDPIKMFLHQAGKKVTERQLSAVRKVALAHSTHGLNSGELTAQLASSVRTTFPRALIASFNIRSGKLHAGAVTECMKQTKEYLTMERKSDREAYIRNLVKPGKVIYGFGHGIHKTNPENPTRLLGKDPRVDLYIKASMDGFPEKYETIHRLIEYAKAIRKTRPSLGANTDFGASVLFHSLELSPDVANGFFTAFRTPGISAQIVNELSVKGNSRRPPFPPVLRY